MNTLTNDLDDGLQRIKRGEGSLGKLLYQDDVYNELDALVSDVRKNPWKLFWKGKEKK
jgi:phospholipid/cholesterol/gamma-HCH transport system substrate-binding protein